MKDLRILFVTLFAALALAVSGCGGGGGSGGGGGEPPPVVADIDGDGIPNEDDAFPDDPGRFAAFREVRLPPLAEGGAAYAVGINDAAVPRVAGAAVSSLGVIRAVTWVAQEGAPTPIRLGPNPDPNPLQESFAYGVDDFGLVVGEANIGGAGRPVVWTGSAVAPTPLPMTGLLADGRGAALAVNNSGLIAGEAESAPDVFVPVVWNGTAAAPVVLSTTPGSAYFLSDTGWVAGEVGGLPVYWTETAPGVFDGPFSLPLLADDVTGAALGVDNLGRIVGESETADGLAHAVLWQQNEAQTAWLVTDLGPASAQAINDFDRIAGYGVGPEVDPATGSRAAVWNTRLTDPTASDPVLEANHFSQAYGMNQGGVIVGAAAGSLGAPEAFAAVPE